MQRIRTTLLSVLVAVVFAFVFSQQNPLEFINLFSNSYSYDIQLQAAQANFLYGINTNNHDVVEDRVRKDQYLSDILEQYKVPVKFINQVASLPRHIFDVRKIAPNKKYTVFCTPDSVKAARAFVYEPNAIDYVVFTFDDSLRVDVCQRDITIVEKSIAGVINSSLSATIYEMGISHELTNKFVDIFAWQVDFQRLQKGDVFKLMYDEIQVEGEPIGIKQINGIYFEHFGSTYYAIP
jgi:hypothetical protein